MRKNIHRHDLSRQTAIAFAVMSIFMSIVFTSAFFTNQPIDKTSAEERTTVYSYYEEEYGWQFRRAYNSLNCIILFSENGEKEYIDGACANAELVQAIESLEAGSSLQMLINSKNNCIIELKADGKEILNFDYAQKKLRQEGVGFLYLSIFLLVLCCYFVYTAITTKERITKEDIKFYWDIIRGK